MKLPSPQVALRAILASTRPLPAMRRPAREAMGCCLAHDIRADRDQPPTDRSAVDGYAIPVGDSSFSRPGLRVLGEANAGAPYDGRVTAGTCVRVFTGAVIPAGAGAVVMQEDVRLRAGRVVCCRSIAAGANIRRRGEDAREGAVALAAGTVLHAAQIGLCAAVGQTAVMVRARPRVAVVSTGLELRAARQSVGPHQIRDANGPTICAAVESAGFVASWQGIVGDEPGQLAEAIRQSLRACQVVMLSGGVSVGRYDFVPRAVRALGGRIRLHGVAMKPGKPLLYATLGAGYVFGLPGNPVSVLVGLHEFAIPALRRLAGWPAEDCRATLPVVLGEDVRVGKQRTEFLGVRLTESSGRLTASLVRSGGSADLVAACKADGVIRVGPGPRTLRAGQVVPFTPWRPKW